MTTNWNTNEHPQTTLMKATKQNTPEKETSHGLIRHTANM